jgi:hypothetical protein
LAIKPIYCQYGSAPESLLPAFFTSATQMPRAAASRRASIEAETRRKENERAGSCPNCVRGLPATDAADLRISPSEKP